jgi:hypothetical protein
MLDKHGHLTTDGAVKSSKVRPHGIVFYYRFDTSVLTFGLIWVSEDDKKYVRGGAVFPLQVKCLIWQKY